MTRTFASRVSAGDIRDRGAIEGLLYVVCNSIDQFTTDKGPTVRFNGQCRLDIPGDPGESIEAGGAYLPSAAGAAIGEAIHFFSEVEDWTHNQYGKATNHRAPEGMGIKLAVAIRMQKSETSPTGYVWAVHPLIDDRSPDTEMAKLIAQSEDAELPAIDAGKSA